MLNIIYKSKRIGQYGKPFTLYKFRSMIIGADKIGKSTTKANDPRVTKIGRIIRKFKIDEIPQLYNVLKGDMVFIGWRPEALEYYDTFSNEILETKPGMTGLATLWNYNEEEKVSHSNNPAEYYERNIMLKKREIELYYVRNKTIWLDIKILIQTIFKVCGIKWKII